jgi:predicted alpha/beta hydrolase family esterase
MSRASLIIVPGWRDAKPGIWYALWAERMEGAVRMVQSDWANPERKNWVAPLEKQVLESPHPVVIVAHGVGCLATVLLSEAAASRIRGALLVAPADPERRSALADLSPVPYAPLPYRSILVASSNDPYCPVRLAGAYARAWGSEFVRMQNAGHISAESGHGDWPLGLALLQSLMDESAAPVAGSSSSEPLTTL